ncbi:MAG TPA: copper chaperone PCu(A)C [Anaerolineae bacterium]|nr:copper chaperone PCu(A)C [Anaerolineae bacterium]
MSKVARLIGTLILIAALLTGCDDPNAPNEPRLEIVDAWAHTAVLADEGNTTSAAYMTIRNTGKVADRLIGASSDFAEFVELHTTEERNGVMMMAPVKAVNIPARGQAVLKPGGLHVMFIKIKHALNVGDTIKLTLEFEKSGKLGIGIPAREP